MYDLGDQFALDLSKGKAEPSCIFTGDKYRITVLTERLIRLEYNENGVFEDNPTELVMCRNFPKPEFKAEQKKNQLIIY